MTKEHKKQLYSYCGNVFHFDELDATRWFAQTYAVSEKQAANNIKQQFRQSKGYQSNTPIRLTGKVITGGMAPPTKIRPFSA